jgi:hypothetical protein
MGRDGNQLTDPQEWGPTLWLYLHCLASKIGTTGNSIIDTDQANYMEYIITNLPNIIPCLECQSHATTYIKTHPLPTLKGLYKDTLRTTTQEWLLKFHNTVRQRKGQPIIINTIEELNRTYNNCVVKQCEFTQLTQSVAYAVRQGWVKIDAWRKWYNFSERLRMLIGNIIQ